MDQNCYQKVQIALLLLFISWVAPLKAQVEPLSQGTNKNLPQFTLDQKEYCSGDTLMFRFWGAEELISSGKSYLLSFFRDDLSFEEADHLTVLEFQQSKGEFEVSLPDTFSYSSLLNFLSARKFVNKASPHLETKDLRSRCPCHKPG